MVPYDRAKVLGSLFSAEFRTLVLRVGVVWSLIGSLWSLSDGHRFTDEHSSGGPPDSASSHLISSHPALQTAV